MSRVERDEVPASSSRIRATPPLRWLPRVSAAFLPVLVVGLSVGFEFARAASGEPIRGSATVEKAGVLKVDGHKLKLYGIHNPASGQACVRNAKPWNCAEGARTALRQHLEGHTVECVPEESDKHVARCRIGDVDLSALLVREGWAKADRDVGDDNYIDEEKEAARARRGIWADNENPEEVRRQQQRNY